jgi:hypothetical protein
MDTKASKLLKQIGRYYKSITTHQKARQALHVRQSRALGRTDKEMQRLLKEMGADVPSLLKETAAKERELKEAHKYYLAFVRPPILPGEQVLQIPPDPNVFDVKPPAVDGFGANCQGLDRGFNLALGETNFQLSQQGDGWGWQATAGLPCFTTLVFQFTPPRAGNVQVDAYVDFKGQFAISAHDHWYTNTNADLTLSVSSRLFQHYWEFGPTVTLLDEHRTNSSNSGWVDRLERLSYTTTLSANDTVLILVEIVLDSSAHSSHARVDVDFKTGAERRIRVPVIRFRYF